MFFADSIKVVQINLLQHLFSLSSSAPSFKDKVLTACFFFTLGLSANLCKRSSSCFLFSSALLSPEIRTTHISSQGQLIQNRGWCRWFKNHIKPPVLVTVRPGEGGRASHICPGYFSVFPIQPPLQLHFLCGQKNIKGTWKANATRLQQLQQSESINDQQMSHKVPELRTGIRSGAETGSRWREFGIQAVLERRGKGFDFAKPIV